MGGAVPMLSPGILHTWVEDRERPGQRHADAPHDQDKSCLRLFAQCYIERRSRGQILEDWREFDVCIDFAKLVDALLKALCNRQIPRLKYVAVVRLRSGLAHEQQVVHLLVDELLVTLEIVFVDVDARGETEEPLELGDTYHWHGPDASAPAGEVASSEGDEGYEHEVSARTLDGWRVPRQRDRARRRQPAHGGFE